MDYGKGMRSIRARFTLAIAVVLSVGIFLEFLAREISPRVLGMEIPELSIVFLFIATSVGLVFYMATSLLRPIQQLKASTEAIAKGDFESPIEVDCQCEIGGLAESFRSMVVRLNANVSRIQSLAYEDGVTGLPNRAALDEFLAVPENATGALVFLDLDGFKQFNDAMGHEFGDALLKAFGARIFNRAQKDSNVIRPLFRFSGDEFVLLLADAKDAENATAIIERLLEGIQAPFSLKGKTLQITATAGIAFFGEDASPAEVLNFASMAMISAKTNARGKYRIFDETIHARAIERAFLEAELRTSIKNGELCVHYQPKINAQTLEITGVEALVRWNHPSRGLIYPGAFMDIAEQTGLIEDIGLEVTRLSALQMRKWESQGIFWPVAINVCPSQFRMSEFSQNVLEYLKQINLPTDRLQFELTESVAMNNPEMALTHIKAFRSAGIKIAIDDYGVGYSNLAQLYKLPFDIIKVDRSLINAIGHDKRGELIVNSIISMAKTLGHSVVAEGVESVSQYQYLKSIGCDEIQGFHFARPMNGDELVRWSRERSGETRKLA